MAVIDDNTVIRTGLPGLLSGLTFVDAYEDVESLLAAAPAVDVVLLDLHLQGTGRVGLREGPDAVREVAEAGYRVCIYTNERRRHLLVKCLMAGASGIVHKAESIEALRSALLQVAGGSIVITQALVGLAELAERRDQMPTLTPRQRQVLSARARGESFRSIARRLLVTEKTAQEHMSVVTAKFADFLRDHSAADLERVLGLDRSEPPHWLRKG